MGQNRGGRGMGRSGGGGGRGTGRKIGSVTTSLSLKNIKTK